MGITAQTKFLIGYDDNNAFSTIEFNNGKVTTNEIEIGLNTLTIQTLIHEINETELCFILNKMGFKDVKIHNKINRKNKGHGYRYFLTHLLSPYGKNTLISPIRYGYFDTSKEGFNIAKYEEVLDNC
jgi:hypothetical protein